MEEENYILAVRCTLAVYIGGDVYNGGLSEVGGVNGEATGMPVGVSSKQKG
jgi:hypothetical protein